MEKAPKTSKLFVSPNVVFLYKLLCFFFFFPFLFYPFFFFPEVLLSSVFACKISAYSKLLLLMNYILLKDKAVREILTQASVQQHKLVSQTPK